MCVCVCVCVCGYPKAMFCELFYISNLLGDKSDKILTKYKSIASLSDRSKQNVKYLTFDTWCSEKRAQNTLSSSSFYALENICIRSPNP